MKYAIQDAVHNNLVSYEQIESATHAYIERSGFCLLCSSRITAE